MKYGAAVKAYYASKGQPVSFPKKGSDDHKAIKALMASGDVTADSAVSAAAAPLEAKAKRVSKKKASVAAPPGAPAGDAAPTKAGGHTTLLDQPHINKDSVAAVDENPVAAPKKARKPRAVQADGESPQMNLLKALTEENSGTRVAPAEFPGLKEQVEKVLEVKPEGIPERKKKVEKAVSELSKTTEGKSAPDMKAIEGRAPFSFAAIRQMLRQ